MIVIPAIDIMGGKCVRLLRGDFAQGAVFSDDPVSTARHWARAGAPLLHMVDLDGARVGHPQQLHLLEAIAREVNVPVQWGGGLRDMEAFQAAFKAGAHRLIVSTALVENPDLVAAALATFGPEKLMVSIDARHGRLAVKGWQELSDLDVTELAIRLADMGFIRIVHTDVDRDGTLTEPNFESIQRLLALGRLRVIASGGISRWSHLERLASMGCEGAIVGRALYTGDLTVTHWFI
jgi:phosphoribosylformimino-5-aminoimidazole carboxamide ribotide isomerase